MVMILRRSLINQGADCVAHRTFTPGLVRTSRVAFLSLVWRGVWGGLVVWLWIGIWASQLGSKQNSVRGSRLGLCGKGAECRFILRGRQ